MRLNRNQIIGGLGALLLLKSCRQKTTSRTERPTEPGVGFAKKHMEMNQEPSPQHIILNKLAYGPRPGDVDRVKKMGIEAFIAEQLQPDESADSECSKKIQSTRLHIEYESGSEDRNKWAGVKEDRALTCLDKDTSALWPLVDGNRAWEEKVRPAEEVRVATLIRAVYSKWQLREILTQFWHNHFNVNISKDERIATLFPVYDRDVIRRNCLGNFRQFLEDVASSAAMGYYLDNAVSRASPANENYARELLELHTLGSASYLNHLYNRWREVPGAIAGAAVGYIDQDVYEAARAFTGWTIADGSDNGKGEEFANTGKFHYYDGWHDNYQKRVLGVEFDPNQPPMADGRRVLDIVAYHPATAVHVCRKLCQRLVCDNPPEELVGRAAEVWTANQKAPDQIKKVVQAIATSPELLHNFGGKVKNPLELVVSFLRATGADFKPNANLIWSLSQMGYMLFEYPAPTGHPDEAEHWLSTNVMAHRWNLIANLMSDGLEAAAFDLARQQPQQLRTSEAMAGYWLARLLGGTPHLSGIAAFMAQGARLGADPSVDDDEDLTDRLKTMVALIAMLPEFQLR